MKSSSKSLAMVSVVFVAFAGGCALIGYDLRDYVPAADAGVEDAGKGGGGEGGAAGSGGDPSSASGTSSTSSGANCPNDCNDNDACTQDSCSNGTCTHLPITAQNDNNACTTDGCDPMMGPTHIQLPNCCPHSLCVTGAPLNTICNPPYILDDCITNVCLKRPLCCSKRWDIGCVELVPHYCTSKALPSPEFSCGKCEHSHCEIGGPLTATCDPCVYAVSMDMPSCVTEGWTAACVELTHSRCGIPRAPDCQ